MRAAALVRRGRRHAEALMVDVCVIRPVAGHTTDTTTGAVSTTYGAPVYSGKCKLQRQRGAAPSNPDAGEHRWTVSPLELHLPVDGTGALTTGHVVEMTASIDPALVGKRYRLRAGDRKTFQTAIRFVLEEVLD